MRYLFNRPIRGSLDTVETMLLVFVFNGMAAAFFGRRHIVIDLLDGVFGARITARADPHRRRPVGAVSRLAGLGHAAAGDARRTNTATSRWSCRLPIYVLWIVALASLAGTIFCALVDAGGEAGDRRRPGAPNEPVADRRVRRRRPVRLAAAARAGLDRAGPGRLLRQCPGQGLGRPPSRSPAPRRSTSRPPTRCRSCRCSS